jgi:adenylate kinase family enzyme
MGPRIHITGAAGAGVSTLGRALAARTGAAHLDTDEFYWLPSDPPYKDKRPAPERLRLLHEAFAAAPNGWILSGAIGGWGLPLVPLFGLVVFVLTPTEVRLERLAAREQARFGAEACAPGGAWHADYVGFLDWAARYETHETEGRSRARHEAWLKTLPRPVVRVDGARPTEEIVEIILAALDQIDG